MNPKKLYELNGIRFVMDGVKYIITGTIISYNNVTDEPYDAVIYKRESDNKMYCVSMQKIKTILGR